MTRTRHNRRLRPAPAAAGVVAVGLLLLAGWTGYQAWQVRSGLLAAAADVQQVAVQLQEGDAGAARRSVASAQQAVDRAQEHTHGPGWSLLERVPGLDDDVAAVRTVVDVTDVLAADVLPDVVDAGEVLDPAALRPRNGRIAIGPIAEVAPDVVAADEELQRQEARVAALDTGRLLGPLAGPVAMMQDELAEASALSGKASYAVRLLPGMLGEDGPRNYLVLFQNNSEIRATGGMPGALAVLRADRGRISIVRQGTAGDLGYHPTPPVPLTREETALFGRELGMFAADVTFTPDFPRVAELASAMWAAEQGQRVDGVLSADPIALSHLLRGTGPVAVPGGPTLTARNAVRLLLNDVYLVEPDPEAQNAYFAVAARSVFDAVAAGTGDPAAVLRGLARGAGEGRLYAWSAEPSEQRLLSETALGGAVPRQAGGSPYLGFFLNDGTAGKLQYYLDHRVDVEPVACNAAGRQTLEVTATLTSLVPEDADLLPPSVIGPREGGGDYLGVEPGTMRVDTHLYAPIDGWIEAADIDGAEAVLNEGEHLGHPVGSQTVRVGPGETRVLRYVVRGGLDQRGPVALRVTPGARSDGVGEVAESACNSG